MFEQCDIGPKPIINWV